MDGIVPHQGRVEFCKEERWVEMCLWSRSDVAVVCRQLGFPTVGMIILIHDCTCRYLRFSATLFNHSYVLAKVLRYLAAIDLELVPPHNPLCKTTLTAEEVNPSYPSAQPTCIVDVVKGVHQVLYAVKS